MSVVRFLSWFLLAIVTVAYLLIPVGLGAQLTLAVYALGVLLFIQLFGPRPWARQLFVAIVSVLIVKYLAWRITETLPPAHNPFDFAAAIALFTAELYSILMIYLTMFVVIDPLERKKVTLSPTYRPTVDVFVPTYNEDVDLVANTLAAAKAMDYEGARLTVYLLDDGGTNQKLTQQNTTRREAAITRSLALMEICNKLDVRYLARSKNEMAKAGNLNHGLAHSDGELIVVLDADHAPRRDFLLKTVGHFEADENLFIAQTPHAFLNEDPIERNLGMPRTMPGEHQMFYRSLQKGLDSWNASYFCGSAAVIRRAALKEVGDFAGLSVTEDCESALEMHRRGWNSRFIDEPLIWGLQPETFTALMEQRARWCSGMLQIFILKNPLFKPGLTMAQRLAYCTTCLYWLFPLARLTFVFAPLLYIFLNMEIFVSSTDQFIAYVAPYMTAVILLQSFLYGKDRWPWMSEVYEYLQSVHLWKAIGKTVIAPRAPRFNVTPKGATVGKATMSSLAWPYFVIFAILVAAQIVAVLRIVSGEDNSLLFIVAGWNALNVIIAGMALGAVCDRRELRTAARLPVARNAKVRVAGAVVDAKILDVSQSGVLVEFSGFDRAIAPGERLSLIVNRREGRVETAITVRRRAGKKGEKRFGASFESTDATAYQAIAALMCAENAARTATRRKMWDRRRPMLIWTGEFLVHAVRAAVRGLTFGWRAHKGRRAQKPSREALARAFPATAIAALILATGLVVDARAEGLRHLPLPGEGLVLQGEWADASVPIHFEAADVAVGAKLKIRAEMSAEALFEATSVDAWVNGRLIGRVEAAPSEIRDTVLIIQPGVLAPGWNRVRFTARHQHRVSCAIDAGYALWTRIDAAATGFRVQNQMDLSLPSLLSTAPTTGFGMTAPAHPQDATRLVNFAAAIADLGGLSAPRATPRRAESITLSVAAPTTDFMPVKDLDGVFARRENGVLVELRLDAQGADRHLARLSVLASQAPIVGSPEGVEARQRRALAPKTLGGTYSFAELGHDSRMFAGRRFVEKLIIDLPADIAPTGDEKVTLTLTGASRRLLSDDARLSIKVNDVGVHERPLDGASGAVLDGVRIPLPIAPFRAGRNVVAIEAELIAPEDHDCHHGVANVTRGRFFLSGDSTLSIPSLARAGTVPNLAAFYWAGLPHAAEGRTNLYVPTRQSFATAATLAMTLATRTDRAATFDVHPNVPQKGAAGIAVQTSAAPLAPAPRQEKRGFWAILGLADETPTPPPAAPASHPIVLSQELVDQSEGRLDAITTLTRRRTPATLTTLVADADHFADARDGALGLIAFHPHGHRFTYDGVAARGEEAARPMLFATHAPTVWNLRRVIGSVLGRDQLIYVIGTLILTTALGIVLALSARSRRVRRDATTDR
ncbi:MAG: UDP-forming cellulose synthase catalytic subunit [Pseudomonadota bacterium]